MSSKWLTDAGELERLNAFCVGKTLTKITYERVGPDVFEFEFEDGSVSVVSTCGGAEIDELRVGADDTHSCSYFCTRPACMLRQRNELHREVQRLRAVITDDLVQYKQTLVEEPSPAQPFDYCYEWDTPLGLVRSFSSARINGQRPDRSIPLYTRP